MQWALGQPNPGSCMRHRDPGSVQTEPLGLRFARQSLAGRAWPLFPARRPDRLFEGITKSSHLNFGGTADHRHTELFALKCKGPEGIFPLIHSI